MSEPRNDPPASVQRDKRQPTYADIGDIGWPPEAHELERENARLRKALDWALDWIEHVSEAPSDEEEHDYAEWEAAHEALTATQRTTEGTPDGT